MDSDIQFGEVEEAQPQRQRRPDRDRHFAVCAYGTLAGGDLAIFVDMDVQAEMEAHAQTDSTVELGGVLLGGQFEDDDGNPFVVVLDSLRAQHYESSSGHFKFTHDTWSEISRQRDEFADDLQMVGWYHTHPSWGCFLSGMDRFICDNFFNRPLDVALVIDPVRGDRGWFYWDPEGAERLPRVSGFSVIASRFREHELVDYVEALEEYGAMKPERALGGSGVGTERRITQQVIHTIRPQLGWIGAAVVAILVLQLFTTMLIALRVGTPSRSEDIDRREQQMVAREEAFQEIIGEVRVGPDGRITISALIDENRALRRQVDKLKRSDVLLDELAGNLEELVEQAERQEVRIGDLEKSKQGLADRNQKLQKEVARLEAKIAKKAPKKTPKPELSTDSATTTTASLATERDAGEGISGGTIVLIVVCMLGIGVLGAAVWRKQRMYPNR